MHKHYKTSTRFIIFIRYVKYYFFFLQNLKFHYNYCNIKIGKSFLYPIKHNFYLIKLNKLTKNALCV